MKIVDIQEKTVSIASDISNAYVDFSQMTASVVAVKSDVRRGGKRLVGYGFNSNGRYAVGGLLRERFIPRLLQADATTLLREDGDNFSPERIWQTMMRGEKPGGHGERAVAVGVIDMAIWDLVAKIADVPLSNFLASRYGSGRAETDVYVYAAGGYYRPGKGLQELQDEIRKYLDAGYEAVKIKVGAVPIDEDLRRIEACLDIVGSGDRLAVDANARFDPTQALEFGRAIEPYALKWYEEAGDPHDFQLQAALCDAYQHPTATGENLFAMVEVRNLIRYGGMRPDRDYLQFDPVLSYGLVEYMRSLRMLEEHGWSPRRCIPHGGHQLSLNVAAGLGLGGNESYPGVFQPFGGFADSTPVVDGRVKLPDTPGVGFEAKASLIELLRSVGDA